MAVIMPIRAVTAQNHLSVKRYLENILHPLKKEQVTIDKLKIEPFFLFFGYWKIRDSNSRISTLRGDKVTIKLCLTG